MLTSIMLICELCVMTKDNTGMLFKVIMLVSQVTLVINQSGDI